MTDSVKTEIYLYQDVHHCVVSGFSFFLIYFILMLPIVTVFFNIHCIHWPVSLEVKLGCM